MTTATTSAFETWLRGNEGILSLRDALILNGTPTEDDVNEHNSRINSAKAHLFGVLVKLATPTLTHYHSDLYYDALWVNTLDFEKLHDAKTSDPDRKIVFYFSYSDTGTNISHTKDIGTCRPNAFKVTLELVEPKPYRSTYYAKFQRIDK